MARRESVRPTVLCFTAVPTQCVLVLSHAGNSAKDINSTPDTPTDGTSPPETSRGAESKTPSGHILQHTLASWPVTSCRTAVMRTENVFTHQRHSTSQPADRSGAWVQRRRPTTQLKTRGRPDALLHQPAAESPFTRLKIKRREALSF